MKNIILTSLLVVLGITLGYGQNAPQGFNYQGVARDASNNPYINQDLGIKISIIQDGSGNIVYSERHLVASSNLGVFNIIIGKGSVLNGDFESIDWGNAEYLVKTDIDPTGGTAYVNIGQSKLLSVPYALFAANGGGSGTPGPQGEEGKQGERGVQGETGPIGPQGLRGEAGTGVKIVGSVSSTNQLPNPYSGDIGDMYITQDNGHGHVWNGSSFDDVGEIKGPKGDQGNIGAMGLKGDQGDKGIQGTAGTNGTNGTNGVDGSDGKDGLSSTWNYSGSNDGPGNFTLNTTTFSAVNTVTINNLDANNVNMSTWLNNVREEDELMIRSEDGNAFGFYKVNTITTMPNSITFTLSSLASNGTAANASHSIAFAKRGPEGAGVKIVGTVPASNNLQIPYSGDIGDLFITENDGHGHVWTGSNWNDVGQIKGDKGDVGEKGDPGNNGMDGTNGSNGMDGDTKWLENGSSIYYNNGAVGIGAAVPVEDLHVKDVDGSGIAVVATEVNNVVNILESSNGAGSIGTASPHNLHLVADYLTQLTIEPDGDIKSGVATWNSNNFSTQLGFPLDINGHKFPNGVNPLLEPYGGIKLNNTSASVGGAMRYTGSDFQGYVGGQWKSLTSSGIGGSGTDNYIPKFNGSNALENSNLYETSSGNIGIGTTNPAWSLDIFDSGNATVAVDNGSNEAFMQVFSGNAFYGSFDNISTHLVTNGSSRLSVTGAGNVGINESSPNFDLSIGGSGTIGLEVDNGSVQSLFQSNSGGYLWSGTGGFDDYILGTNLFGRLVIAANGNVGIGVGNPIYQLQLSQNSAAKPGGGSWSNFSDERLKKDIKPYEAGLDELIKINTVKYKYNEISGIAQGEEFIGIIAQEMKDIAPYTVSKKPLYVNEMAKAQKDGDDQTSELREQKLIGEFLSFDGSALTYMTINAIQEQQTIIEEQRTNIEVQQSQIDYLIAELQAIKKLLKK